MEDTLNTIVEWLQKLDGLPAGALVLIICIVLGYLFRCIKRFPNDAIPVVAILMGGVIYPLIADANNNYTLRVWIVRNAIIGLALGFAAWMVHNQVLKRIEDKLGLFAPETPPVTSVPTVSTNTASPTPNP